MLGLMQNQQLLISSLIEFADRHHGEGEIVSRRPSGVWRCRSSSSSGAGRNNTE